MNPKLLPLVALLALTGCSSVPTEIASRMNAASEKYAVVQPGAKKEALLAALGAPQEEQGSKAVWEVRHNGMNYDSLAVEFDAAGRVASIQRKHFRGSISGIGSAQKHTVFEQ